MTLTVPCLFGLESLVADEMRRLDLKNVRAENGRVHCEGTLADIARLNVNLRCGARVLMELGSFPARDFEALFQGVYALPWENYIPRDGEFPVKGYSLNSQLHSAFGEGSHTAACTPKQGAFRMGVVSLLSERSARSPTSPGRVSERQVLPLLGLGRGCSQRTQKAFGTAMRLCASLFRGVAAPLGCVIPWLFLLPH